MSQVKRIKISEIKSLLLKYLNRKHYLIPGVSVSVCFCCVLFFSLVSSCNLGGGLFVVCRSSDLSSSHMFKVTVMTAV